MNKISDVNFGYINARVQTYFIKLQLQTVKEIVDYPVQDLIKIKGFGRKAYTAVLCTLLEQFPDSMKGVEF
tara:strand:+ start:94 stop:306 length:213 start_codon:yes stop_codon:yes gene_type:complete